MRGRWPMACRVAVRGMLVRPAKLLLTLCALSVGATLTSAFLSLYLDLPEKMSGEFRTLGPNLLVAPRQGADTFSKVVYARIASDFPGISGAPWLYAVAEVERQKVVVAGTELDRIRQLQPSWQLLPRGDETLGKGLVAGEKVAGHFGWSLGETVALRYADRQLVLPVVGILSTGGSEDTQVLVPLADLEALTGKQGQLSLVALAVSGPASEVERVRATLAERYPEVEARPLRPVLESAARVVMKVKGLMLGLTFAVLALVILSVLTTVSGLVLDRQRDIGIMKALGGSDRSVAVFFLTETAALAGLSGFGGYGVGLQVARWAGERMFQSAVAARWDVLIAVVATTLLVALIATAVPARWIRRMQPAVILRGE